MKSLNYFMRDNRNEVVEVEAPPTFKDEKGNPIMMRVRKLSQKEINDINDKYRTNRVMKDKRGNPIVNGGQVVRDKSFDAESATQMLIVKSLEYPDLTSKELMDYYKCVDVTEMPQLVFKTFDEYNYIVNTILEILGISDKDEEEGFDTESFNAGDVEEAKNLSDEQVP